MELELLHILRVTAFCHKTKAHCRRCFLIRKLVSADSKLPKEPKAPSVAESHCERMFRWFRSAAGASGGAILSHAIQASQKRNPPSPSPHGKLSLSLSLPCGKESHPVCWIINIVPSAHAPSSKGTLARAELTPRRVRRRALDWHLASRRAATQENVQTIKAKVAINGTTQLFLRRRITRSQGDDLNVPKTESGCSEKRVPLERQITTSGRVSYKNGTVQ